jgi:hypothetical protein
MRIHPYKLPQPIVEFHNADLARQLDDPRMEQFSAPMIPVLQVSFPQEQRTKESPANSFRGSAPQ